MAAVSQLASFARSARTPASRGVELIETPRCRIQIVPDFPLPGPNNVSWIRCRPEEVDGMVAEARRTFGAQGLPFAWIIDPEAQPPDLVERLRAHGFAPDPHGETSAVMILPVTTRLDAPAVEGLAIEDALASFASFEAAEMAAAEAFGGTPFGAPSDLDSTRRRRFDNHRGTPNRRIVLAIVGGEPAGSGSLTIHAPGGGIMNGGAVRPKFRGLGVYRSMVAARLELVRQAGAAGLVVWGGDMSRPILERLGFETVSWRKFYI